MSPVIERDERRSLLAQGAIVTLIAALIRGAVVAWSAGKFPAAADGVYYQKLAERIASGAGYTWLWPDGVVTAAAHYPVGYPAIIALAQIVGGDSPTVAAVVNALLGTIGVLAIHQLVGWVAGRRAALVAAMLSAVDPALVLYTPAVMTEGVTASLLVIAAAFAVRGAIEPRRFLRWTTASGFVLGIATLVRPQSLLIAPLFGALAAMSSVAPANISASDTAAPLRSKPWLRGLMGAAVSLVVCVGVCLPWTARNCVSMKSCALVSVNGGWNLLIGTNPAADGHWASIDVPDVCREVYDEAAKDACFGKAARQKILADPRPWISLMPRKLAATFDAAIAAPWYLHEANWVAFDDNDKRRAQIVEIAFERLILLSALVLLVVRAPWPVRAWRAWRERCDPGSVIEVNSSRFERFCDVAGRGVAVVGITFCVQRTGWPAYLCAAISLALLPAVSGRIRLLGWASASVIGATAIVHAAFFGAGRYSLVVLPFVTSSVGALLTFVPTRSDSAARQLSGPRPSA